MKTTMTLKESSIGLKKSQYIQRRLTGPIAGTFLVQCLSWWSQVHVPSGCPATFPAVWMEERPPTSPTFSSQESFRGSMCQESFIYLSLQVNTSLVGTP